MERKLTAILCADVYGYSRLMGEDEEATIRNLSAHRRTIDRLIEQHHGRFVNSAGDSVLAEFASAVNAVECAVEIQTALITENAEVSPGRRMEFRIGVNLGDVVVEGREIYGDGVNVAARLESLAEPGSIYISASIHEQIGNKLALSYEDLGEQHVKNIAKPVRVFRVLPNGTAPTLRERRRIPGSYWRGGILSLAGIAIALTTFVLIQHLSLRPPHTHASIPPQERPALPLPDIPSIAVLPFTNLSGDSQQEYFSDGISNQLIEDLSRLPGLFVIARNSSFAFKGKSTSEQEIARQLGVKYILEGNIRRAADRVRIGVELVDASSGTEMWTQRFDRPLKDIFAVQDEIVGKVVTTLGLILKLARQNNPSGAGAPATDNLDAFDDFLRSQEYIWRSTKQDNERARYWADKAIEQDPHFADAYATVGWTHLNDGWNQWGMDPRADFAEARKMAEKALALDDSNAGALALIAELDWQQGHSEQAVIDGRRAVNINPNYAFGYLALADAFSNDQKPEKAHDAVEKAIRLDPAGRGFYSYQLGNSDVQRGHYLEGIPILKMHVSAYPNSLVGHSALLIAYTDLGRDSEARAEAAEIMRISPHFTVPVPDDNAWHKHVVTDWRKAGLK
jgi:adenylate cyclase